MNSRETRESTRTEDRNGACRCTTTDRRLAQAGG
jgi:hypothetical protein